jgi:tetratricopeptide (TPR) repeat protein
MTARTRILEAWEVAADAQASLFMEEGIRLMQSGGTDAALLCFDRAFELRRGLPIEMPVCAYGLAAVWLNRAEALTRCGPGHFASALCAYEEALALLRPLPLSEDPRFPKRLAIACQNQALLLAAQRPPGTLDAIQALFEAVSVLENAETMNLSERDYVLAVVCLNLANIQSSQNTAESILAARQGALRALTLVRAQEQSDVAAAEAGLKARHVLCHIAARRLSIPGERETTLDDVHEATDLSDEGLLLVRQWERRGIERFRNLAADLFRFGARVYAAYQPHFLREFINEQLDTQQSTPSYVGSREMRDAARDILSLLRTRSLGTNDFPDRHPANSPGIE